MGSCMSSTVRPSAGSGKADSAKQQRRQRTHERITRVLGDAKGEKDKTGNPISFDKYTLLM